MSSAAFREGYERAFHEGAPVTSWGRSPAVVGPLGGMVLAASTVESSTAIERALGWWNALQRLGSSAPLFVVHDLGSLYGAPPGRRQLRPATPGPSSTPAAPGAGTRVVGGRLGSLALAYRALIGDITAADAATRLDRTPLRDDLVVVVLARLLEPPPDSTWPLSPWTEPVSELPELDGALDARLSTMFDAHPRGYEEAWLDAFLRDRLHVVTRVDALEVDTLRLLGMLGARTHDSPFGAALGYVDLLAALANPTADRVVGFSLELLPRVLETQRPRGHGTHAIDGYGGIGPQGTSDSILLTELAWDDDEFDRRLLDRELLFFTREQEPEPVSRLHHILVDASASMRGDREVFARGLALAMAKKLELLGEEARTRFFDSRLYDAPGSRSASRSRSVPAAWVLGFKGERGRNPARVFAQLATELAILRARDPRELVVHLVTHAALHVPRELVTEVCRLARVFCVFILPSHGGVELDWLDLVESYSIVDQAALRPGGERVRVGATIVERLATCNRTASSASSRASGSRSP